MNDGNKKPTQQRLDIVLKATNIRTRKHTSISICVYCICICCVHTIQPQCVAYGLLLLLLPSSLFVCCASFVVCALFCTQTMRTENSGKNWRKKARQKLLPALLLCGNFARGKHGGDGATKNALPCCNGSQVLIT